MTYTGMSKWRRGAEAVINREIRAGFAAGQTVGEIRQRVDAAYPFGPREYHPYKLWLAVRREAFAFHGLRTDAEKARDALIPAKTRRGKYRVPADIEGARRDGLIR